MHVSKIITTVLLFLVPFAFARAAWAQSTDQNLPTAVLSNDISGKIAALDVGDPRVTRHFYAFAASPGDLLITVDSKNLNGDVDVFTAITFKPLMKTTVYASSQSPSVAKGIYLRAHQILILRIEARSPNDDPGTYRIHFGGTFEPFSGGIPVAENTETETPTGKPGANRLSSVGATIPRPPVEVRETASATPSPSPEKPVEKVEEKPAEVTEAPKTETVKPATGTATTSRRTTPRTTRRGTRPAPARTRPVTRKPETAKTEPLPAGTEQPEKTTPPEKSKTQELMSQPAGPRLIIEEKDGTRIERAMSSVRRVIVEGPTIVVVLKNGQIERILMRDVVRMAIEPQ